MPRLNPGIIAMLGPDFYFETRGAMDVLTPVTREAFAWSAEYLPADNPRVGSGFALEHSEAFYVLESVRASGLEVADGADVVSE